MPLKALLNDVKIHSFEFSSQGWTDLKQSYKKNFLIMECCGQDAIPKTSKLNNYYFAHKCKTNNHCEKESAEHIYLKFIIAKIAYSAGWNVTTEKRGESTGDDFWIADVFCTKNKVKLAFEIQISQQTDDEFKRRQDKYIASGVRTLWLRKLRKRSEEYGWGIYEDYDLPVFGIRKNESGDFYLPQFDISIEDFISGIFTKKLLWSPKIGETLTARTTPHYVDCWRCNKVTGIIAGICIFNNSGVNLIYLPFSYGNAKNIINMNIDHQRLNSFGVGTIKSRYSKALRRSYLSNGCVYSDALMGDFFYMKLTITLMVPSTVVKQS